MEIEIFTLSKNSSTANDTLSLLAKAILTNSYGISGFFTIKMLTDQELASYKLI